jgi:hypothetical protein
MGAGSQEFNEKQGEFATEWVAHEYEVEVRNNEQSWYDAVNPRTGTKYECKSTRRELDDGSTGRFRLWEDQHRSLEASDASGVAWYAFVLPSTDGSSLVVQRRKPRTVGRIIERRGGWNTSGHRTRRQRQHKLPWPEVIDE